MSVVVVRNVYVYILGSIYIYTYIMLHVLDIHPYVLHMNIFTHIDNQSVM